MTDHERTLQQQVDALRMEVARLERELAAKYRQTMNEVADMLLIVADEMRRTGQGRTLGTLGALDVEPTLLARLAVRLAEKAETVEQKTQTGRIVE